VLTCLATLLVTAPQAQAQCTQSWLPVPSSAGANGQVLTYATLANGDIIVGGSFTSIGGIGSKGIARYVPSTGTWSSLGQNLIGYFDTLSIYAILVLPSGELIVGGDFLVELPGMSAGVNIARFNPTTNTWTGMDPVEGNFTGTDGPVRALALLPNGNVAVAGDFLSVFVSPQINSLAEYNPSARSWSRLALEDDISGYRAINVLPNGDILAGGEQFFELGEARIGRRSQANGTWTFFDTGMSGAVESLLPIPGGEVLVGGGFSNAGGNPSRNNIARLNPANGAWASVGSGTNGAVSAMLLTPANEVIVGGGFTSAGGVNRNRLAKLNPVTNAWSDLTTSGTNGPVRALLAQQTSLFVGGDFSNAGGVQGRNNFATYNLAANQWTFVGALTNAPINALSVLPGGVSETIVAGNFTSVLGDTNMRRIARYNPTTNGWSPLGTGVNNVVYATAVLADGDVVAGGIFTEAGGVAVNRIARFDVATSTWSALSAGINNTVRTMLVLPNGNIIVAGNFTTAGGVSRNNITQYNPTTNTWSSFGVGTNSAVFSLLRLNDGSVLVGGSFTSAGNVNGTERIARLNPTNGTWSAVGTNTVGADSSIESMVLLPNGEVILGGFFTTIDGVPAERIARFNPSNNTFTALGAGTNGGVLALTLRPAGDVIVAGQFTTAGGVSGRNYVARYNPTTNAWSSLGTGVNSAVNALAALPGGDFLAGGNFSSGDQNVASYFARYTFGAPTINNLPDPTETCAPRSATISVLPNGTGPFTYQWRKNGTAINPSLNPSAATANLTFATTTISDAGSYDCLITTTCGSVVSTAAPLTVRADCCDSIDFNNDASSFDPQDIEAFLSVFSEGPCIPATATCNDIDFNNDGALFDPCDIDSYLLVFSEGPCTLCGV
jgi:hypothetical protein